MDSTMDVGAEMLSMYEREDILMESVPPAAIKRLPFHLFLYQNKADVDKYLKPAVFSELSIYNVPVSAFVVSIRYRCGKRVSVRSPGYDHLCHCINC